MCKTGRLAVDTSLKIFYTAITIAQSIIKQSEVPVDNHIHQIWNEALNVIQEDVSVTKISFTTWFASLEPLAYIDGIFYVKVSDSFTLSILSGRYQSLVDNALHMVIGQPTKVKFITDESDIPQHSPKKEEEKDNQTDHQSQNNNSRSLENSYRNNLNPKYSFDKFVIGENNRFAHAACVAVSEAPSERYNPLFIYGGVGLGKTHLMQAIGNYILEYTPGKKVVYISCETFINEFIEAIQNKDNNAFRNRYRSVDILLIDDIQFLAGKDGTQEEFFHTFNALHEENKQIVISSDRPPKEIPNLAERLRSRFEMGLITDISAPNFETRMAILRKKAEAEPEYIPDEVLSFIADHIHSNIRELEGALTTVIAYSKLHGNKLTLDVAKEALHDLFTTKQHEINADYIKEITAKYFNVTIAEINGKKRTKNITLPRQVAMYLCREMTNMSLPKIGEEFGGRDHSTVIHACSRISDNIEQSADFKNLVVRIQNEIQGS